MVSGMVEGNGTYSILSSGGDYSWSSAYKLFDGNRLYGSNSSGFSIANKTYSITDGYYTGETTTTDMEGNTFKGEWIDFYFPISMVLKSIYIYRMWTGNQPYNVVILGSNDKTNWVKLSEKTSCDYALIGTNPDIYQAIVNVDADQMYPFYRLVVLRVGVVWSNGNYYGGGLIQIGEIEFYGTV